MNKQPLEFIELCLVGGLISEKEKNLHYNSCQQKLNRLM